MAQPKRRWSKARTHLKRSTWKLENQNLVDCPHCHEKYYNIEYVQTADTMMEKEVVAKSEE